MFTKCYPFLIYAETPVHTGAGESDGIVDMVIQRDVFTKLPIIHGQSLKGAFREFFKNNEEPSVVSLIFGPSHNADHASCISISKAEVLLFPVSTLKGVFAYVTSKTQINKFCSLINKEINIGNIASEKILLTENSDIKYEDSAVVAEYPFKIEKNKEITKFAEILGSYLFKNKNYMKEILKYNLAVVNDDIFKQITQSKTEIVYRNKIGEDGVAEEHGLWTEEYLPELTILFSNLYIGKPLNEHQEIKKEDDVIKILKEKINKIFIGANKTVGKGLVNITFLEERL